MLKEKLGCPRCKSTDLIKAGKARGKQRYRCQNPNCTTKGGWHGTVPLLRASVLEKDDRPTVTKDSVEEHVKSLRQYKRDTEAQRYVITAAQNATPVHQPFWDALLTYCEATGARLMVIPYRYKNPTSHWGKAAISDDWWDPQVLPFCVNHRFSLNHKVEILADVKTQPTATSPLTGMETVSGNKWSIIGHAKEQLVVVPHNTDPKVMATTGACTKPNYTPTKAGKKGEHHHIFGAAVVETRGNKTAFVRHISCDKQGGFYDFDGYFKANHAESLTGVAALVMGDTHVDFVDPACVRATFGPDGMIEALNPEHLIWHDLNDFYAGSHHHERPDMWFTRHLKVTEGRDDVKEELERAFQFVNEHSPAHCVNVFPYSNHANEHLWKWLNRTNPQRDHTNFRFWLDTWQAIDDSKVLGDNGAECIDPFAYWGARMLTEPSRSVFLGPNDTFDLHGVNIGGHGHLGPNGARGSLRNLARIGSRSIFAHLHAPGMFEGAMQVGTSSRRRLEYTHGPSSWMHTHGVLYPNGKRTLAFCMGDEWRV